VVITGANPGSLAFEAAKSIAARQPGLLVLTARSESLLQQTRDAILTETADLNIKLVAYDLSKQEMIRKAVSEVKALNVKFDVIINSAGVMAPPYALTAEGIESQFGINHIGRPLLTSIADCTGG
jgi:short-subunit dehydrogenase